MGYCTTGDVQGRFKSLTFAAVGTSGITEAKVQDLIDLNTSAIDARVGKVYETRVTGTESLKVLKLACLYLTVADLEPMVNQAATKEKGADGREKSYYAMAESLLCRIESGQTDLSDATRKSTARFASGNVANSVTPVFKKDCRQW